MYHLRGIGVNAMDTAKASTVAFKLYSPRIRDTDPHVVKIYGKWALKCKANPRIRKFFEKKSDAIDAGMEVAKAKGKKLRVHNSFNLEIPHSPFPTTLDEAEVRRVIREVMREDNEKNGK
jgi:hypothetical protein